MIAKTEAEILKWRTEKLAQRSDVQLQSKVLAPILIFTLGEEKFAARMTAVSGVVPIRKLTKVPTADARILGIMSVKGEVHTIFDLAGAMSLPKSDSIEAGYAVILRQKEIHIGVRVDRVEAIDSIDEKASPAPSPLAGRSFVKPEENEALVLIEDFNVILGTFIHGETQK